jgi:Fe-S cluster assembly protein SufD
MTTLTTNYLTPTGREEAWRFTPLKRLGGLHDGTALLSDRHSLSLKSAPVNGVSFGLISSAEVNPISESDDVIVARIRDNAKEVSVLTISANTEVAEPILLGRNQGTLDSAEFSRVLIRLESHAHATVIIENTGDTHLAEDLEISLAPGANLTLVSLQEWESKSIHAGRQHAVVDRDATFKSIVVTIGGSLVRLLPTVEFAAPGASCELLGVYFATSGQFFEHRMFVDHKVPNAKSRVNYKGALAGDQAHTVWIGDVFIRAAAEGTDTYELNRNLLLSDGARADSVPNLEIETGEIVGAGHASTTGRFDDEQLFYLMSRGIALADARRLVVRGFFNEIVSEIGSEEIQSRLMDRIDNELAKAGA